MEVDCIIKMKKITAITDNNFYTLLIDIMKLQLLCAIKLGKKKFDQCFMCVSTKKNKSFEIIRVL